MENEDPRGLGVNQIHPILSTFKKGGIRATDLLYFNSNPEAAKVLAGIIKAIRLRHNDSGIAKALRHVTEMANAARMDVRTIEKTLCQEKWERRDDDYSCVCNIDGYQFTIRAEKKIADKLYKIEILAGHGDDSQPRKADAYRVVRVKISCEEGDGGIKWEYHVDFESLIDILRRPRKALFREL